MAPRVKPAETPRPAKPQQRHVTIDGRQVFVRGVGRGEPVLLVNGIGAHTAMWSVVERALAGRQVVSFDAPGAGRSKVGSTPVSVASVARIATGVLDHFGIDRADVLGYSMGGMIVQQLLADAPGRVRRAVLVATSPGVGGVHGSALSMLNVMTPARYLSRRLYMGTIGSLAGGRARDDREWVRLHGTLRLLQAPSMRGYLSQLTSLVGWSGLGLLGSVEHPVLVVTGTDDPLTPVANSKLLAHLLPHGRLLELEGEGHLLLMDSDSAAHAPIRRFLEGATPDFGDARPVSRHDVRVALADVGRQLQPFGLAGQLNRLRVMGVG